VLLLILEGFGGRCLRAVTRSSFISEISLMIDPSHSLGSKLLISRQVIMHDDHGDPIPQISKIALTGGVMQDGDPLKPPVTGRVVHGCAPIK